MKLLILADAASAHTLRWTRALASRGHEIRLFTLTPPGNSYPGSTGVHVVWPGLASDIASAAEGSGRKLHYLRALPALWRTIRVYQPDLVHAHYASSYGLLAMLAGARPRIVSVWGLDVFSFPRRSKVHRRVLRAVLASADAVLSTSEVMRREVLSLIDRPVEVTPFGVDTDQFSPGPVELPQAPLRIGTVKTLEPKYGIEFLIKAFAIVARQGRHPWGYRLVIVGGGALRSTLERLAQDLDVAGQVQFVGPCPYDEVAAWHRSFDLAVYPSIDPSESFGVAAVESQACGVPVVVSRVGGLPEVVAEGRTGLLVPPSDPEALARAMLELLDDPEMRRAMGTAARQHVLEHLSLAACTDKMEQVYKQVAADAGGRPRREPASERS